MRPGDVRRRHRRRDGRARAAGAGHRRGARRRRPRRRRRSTTSAPQRGIETRLLPATPFPHTFLDVVGLQRELNRRNVRRQRGDGAEAGRGDRRAPCACCGGCGRAVVVSVGGYASLPGRARRPPARHPDRRRQLRPPARAGQRARRPGSPPRRPSPTRTRRCRGPSSPGAPLRRAHPAPSTAAGDRARGPRRARAARRPLRGRRHRRLAGLGGAQRRPSPATSPATPTTPALAVRQVVGDRFLAAAPRRPRRRRRACSTRSSATTTASSSLYAAADLLVGRGGASTVAEVAVTGTPAVLVPWSGAAEDHQTLQRALARRPGRRRAAARGRARPRSATLIDGLRADPTRARRARRRGPHAAGDAAPRRRAWSTSSSGSPRAADARSHGGRTS